jgi:hypothetical protein
MLITLQSNSDSDASDFVNFFKETVQIPEGAEVALLGCSYKFVKTFTVTALNNEYLLTLASTDQFLVQLTPGEYTVDSFLTELNSSLNNALATAPYQIALGFPDTAQVWAWTDGNKNRLKLTLTYSPTNWDGALIEKDSTRVRQQVELADPAQMEEDGEGILDKTSYSDSYDQGVNAGTATLTNMIWGTAEGNGTGETPHGTLRFQVPQLCQCCAVLREGQKTTGFGTAGNYDVGIHFLKSGTFEIRERVAGTLSVIKTDNYSVNDFFEIRVDSTDDATQKSVRYFKKSGGPNFTEINITGGSPRYEYSDTTKLIPGAGVKTPIILGGIHANPASIGTNADYQLTAILSNDLVIADGSNGYTNGELCACLGVTSGATATIKVETDGLGSITDYTVERTDGGFTAGEQISVTGSFSGIDTATLTYSDPITVIGNANLSALTGTNTGYTAGVADLLLTGNGETISGAVTIQVDGSGAITDFGFVSQGKVDEIGSSLLKSVDDNEQINIVQGGNSSCDLFVRNIRDVIPAIQGLGWTTVEINESDEPLGLHDQVRFRCGADFNSLTGMPLDSGTRDATGGTEITGTRSIGTDRETQQMLINIEEFNIKSICKEGGIQKAIAVLPYGATEPSLSGAGGATQKIDGEFYYEPYNIVYHRFDNPFIINHNQLRCRLTDALGRPIGQLQHPVTVTLDLRPKAK